MTPSEFDSISKLEADLWSAADNLRANSKLTSSEYCMPVLGIIFLRHAANRYETALKQIQDDQTSGKIPKRKLVKADFIKRRALMLPEEARYGHLLSLAGNQQLGEKLVEAMNAIERDFEPLAGQLPKDYERFDADLLEQILRTFDSEALRTASGDVFGRIYEYFLMKFAMQGAQDNGEFFTPPSLVQLIVNVIEPDHGVVADLACGSAGMFVQSSHFIEDQGGRTMDKVTFYGQEKTATTIRLAKMNLAVHGLEGDIREANTFYEDVHELADGRSLWGNCDFIMANPPFNVDMVDSTKIKGDRRLPFGLPGVNKDKKVSNGNYLWISYFHSYLSKTGRSGFVMSSQASSAGHGEAEVRRKLVETGDVDVMVSVRSNFFYTRTVPCELWHFDKGKPESRKDQVLMLDARNVFRKVTRKIFDFTPEQQKNLTAIVWLYRGQSDRFTDLVQQYLERTLAEAAVIATHANAFRQSYEALVKSTATFLKSLPKDSPVRELVKERDDEAKSCFASLDAWTTRIAKDWKKPCAAKPAAQLKFSAELETLAAACRDLVKDVDLVSKLALRVVDSAEKDAGAKDDDSWNTREIGKLEKDLEVHRAEIVEQLKATAYFERQAHWLLSRFPDAKLVDVPGLVKLVDRAEIAAADWSLTPGRYVGVAPAEVDDDFDFEQALGDIHVEIKDLNQEAAELAKRIQKNFEGLGV
jgi:type I restriction enzyme M protein